MERISQIITEECKQDYYCRDNVTLIVIDLKKYLAEHLERSAKSQTVTIS